MTLADRILKRISAIPARNPGYISMAPETLDDVISYDLLRLIAKEAAAEAEAMPSPQTSTLGTKA
jgi:hypothetical protein